MARYYYEYEIKHLVIDCPHNPNIKGKATLNAIKVIPSLETTPTPSGEDNEGVKPLNKVSQAQKLNNPGISEGTQID